MKEILSFVINNKTLSKLVLSKPVNKSVIRSVGRLIEIKGKGYLALETFLTDGKAVQKNIPFENAPDAISLCIPHEYKQMNIITANGSCEVKVSGKGKITVMDRIKRENREQVVLSHDRKKKYIIPSNEPVDFLVALGVQDSQGHIFDKKRSKFRQINRFLETVADIEDKIGKNDLYILDLCCGKSYLSFALYYYFTVIKGLKVTMDCVDLKKDVIEFCSGISSRLGYEGLNFIAGDINEFNPLRTPDLTVSLHACDIATDIVLAKGINAGSKVIMSTPCCHHEMTHQLKPTGAVTDFMLEHSILKQKFADAATDSLRCMMLQMHGYDVNAIELIDPEETPKNVLIRAVKLKKRSLAHEDKCREDYKAICHAIGVKPCLAKLLGEDI